MTAATTCPSNASSTCSSIDDRAMRFVHPRTDGTDITKNWVQVDESSLDLIARRELTSGFDDGLTRNGATR